MMRIALCIAFLFIVAFLEIGVASVPDSQIPTVDGVIDEGEYPCQIQEQYTNIKIYWYNDEVYLWIGLVSPGVGWVAIAFEPESYAHYGANIIIGYVKNGQLFIGDHYGAEMTRHELDETLGGTNDILESAGTESEGKTTIEFKIPLDSGDQFDKVLEPNKSYNVFVAYHATADDLMSEHTERAILTIVTVPEFPETLIVLLLFMSISLLVALAYRKWMI